MGQAQNIWYEKLAVKLAVGLAAIITLTALYRLFETRQNDLTDPDLKRIHFTLLRQRNLAPGQVFHVSMPKGYQMGGIRSSGSLFRDAGPEGYDLHNVATALEFRVDEKLPDLLPPVSMDYGDGISADGLAIPNPADERSYTVIFPSGYGPLSGTPACNIKPGMGVRPEPDSWRLGALPPQIPVLGLGRADSRIAATYRDGRIELRRLGPLLAEKSLGFHIHSLTFQNRDAYEIGPLWVSRFDGDSTSPAVDFGQMQQSIDVEVFRVKKSSIDLDGKVPVAETRDRDGRLSMAIPKPVLIRADGFALLVPAQKVSASVGANRSFGVNATLQTSDNRKIKQLSWESSPVLSDQKTVRFGAYIGLDHVLPTERYYSRVLMDGPANDSNSGPDAKKVVHISVQLSVQECVSMFEAVIPINQQVRTSA